MLAREDVFVDRLSIPHLTPRLQQLHFSVVVLQLVDDHSPPAEMSDVFVRRRPAEVDHRTVAQELGDVTAPPLDDLLAAVVIRGHRRSEILRVQATRKLGRADEVTEDHRDLPTLGDRARSRRL